MRTFQINKYMIQSSRNKHLLTTLYLQDTCGIQYVYITRSSFYFTTVIANFSSSMKNYATASPMSTDSQGVDTQNQVPSGTMRGKSIAQRSAGLKKGSTDILTIASTWGVNILHVDHVINWISQLMLKAKRQRMTKEKTSPSKRVSQTRLPKVATLQETYIKVEDLGFKYRPIFHEFKLWPEITFSGSSVCPFDPPRGRSSENSVSVSKRKNGEESVK